MAIERVGFIDPVVQQVFTESTSRREADEARFDAEAIMRMDTEGPITTRAPKGVKSPYDALDRQLMAAMDWEGPAVGRRVRGGAISAAKFNATEIAKQNGPRIPGAKGNGKA